jgi:riboflavin kinase, archaea type
VAAMRKITGVIFSDLGQASSFMKLDWVQRALAKSLGFAAFPATLNVRPKTPEDAQVWQNVQNESNGIPLPAAEGGFCAARLYPVEIQGSAASSNGTVNGAVLLPDVTNYPKDKIEIVAPVRLKEAFGVQDGDQITLEFVN